MSNEVKDLADEATVACRYCGRTEDQTRAGANRSGSQRYHCGACERHYTLRPRRHGYPDTLRRQAVEMHRAGVPFRRIGSILGVNHQSVVNWIRQHDGAAAPSSAPAAASPAAPQGEGENGHSGKQRATIEDVARRAGVSVATVSNLLNNKGRMAEETRRRIRAAVEELHFTPNALVRAIRARRTRILGVLIFDLNRIDANIERDLSIPLLAGIYDAADAAGHDILLYTGWPGRPARHSGLDFLNGHVDGLLWSVPEIGAPALERVAAAGLPVVAMLSRHVPDGVGYINADNIGATRDLIAHLAERGHRRIAFAGPAPHSSNYADRLEGYRQGMAAAGLPADPVLEAISPESRRSDEACARIVDAWLALPAPPTAVVSVSDGWAEGIGNAAQARGLRIPDDLALTGFDDVPAARTVCGGLTTVHQPFRQIGSVAVERLIALISGAPIESCRVTIPTEQIVRASTGGGAAASPDHDAGENRK